MREKMKKDYIVIGKIDKTKIKLLYNNLITDEVVITYERMKHIEEKRKDLYKKVKKILPDAIFNPEYIYKDWNERDNTIVLIKQIDKELKLNIIIKTAVKFDEKHTKNSIITMMEIGDKTFNKILKNKKENLIFENKTGQKRINIL